INNDDIMGSGFGTPQGAKHNIWIQIKDAIFKKFSNKGYSFDDLMDMAEEAYHLFLIEKKPKKTKKIKKTRKLRGSSLVGGFGTKKGAQHNDWISVKNSIFNKYKG